MASPRAILLVASLLLAGAPALDAQPVLTHGQAVGDPLPDTASVWARTSGPAQVSVLYGTDPQLAGAQETPPTLAGPASDFAVRIDLTGLAPGTTWYYRLRLVDPANPGSGGFGPIGRFRTAPAPAVAEDLTFTFTADILDHNWYVLFGAMAALDPDLVLFLGDFPYADSSPAATTLAQYRQKHQLVRDDPTLQGLLRQAAMAPIWDDHEIRNDWDAATDPARVALGRMVWKEWFPVRPNGDAVYRKLRYGSGIELFILDTRTYRGQNAAADLPGRTLLGSAQKQWLLNGLMSSGAIFKVIVSSVPLRYGTTNKDHWQGYMRDRQELLAWIQDHRIPNVLFISGDQHWSAVHHHREGVLEVQACPLATGIRPPPPEPEPEVIAIHPVRSFGALRVHPTATPPRIDIEIHDVNGIVDSRSFAAGVPGALRFALDPPGASFVAAGPHRFRNDGAHTELPYAPPGTYTLELFGPSGSSATAPVPVVLEEGGFISVAADLGLPEDPAHPTLFRDDFDDPSLPAWTVVDEGTIDPPSAWFVDDYQLVQSSNLHGGQTTAASPDKPGTYLAAGDIAWTDVTFSFRVKTHDDDGIGAMFRLGPDGSCYRFAMDRQRNYQRLTRTSGGITTTLVEAPAGYQTDHWYDVTIKAIGPNLSVALDGQVVLSTTDHVLPSGRIALYSWGSQVVWFDRVVVRAGDVQPATPAALLAEDFSSGTLTGWTVVDQGTISAPSVWGVTSGSVIQTSNIHGGSLVGSDPHKPGTFLLRGDPAWTDVEISLRLMSPDDDALGVMFRVVDPDNYYRFSMDAERSYRRLTRTVAGLTTTLVEMNAGYVPSTWSTVVVRARGPELSVELDGVPILSTMDTTFPAGRIALYVWGAVGARFDDILVTPVTGAPTSLIAHGTATQFALDLASPAWPGRSYVVALALGTSPGIPLVAANPNDPRVIPLNPDPLFFYSLGSQPYFSSFSGALDAGGRATATVGLPPNLLPPGFTFHAAGIVLDPLAPTGIAAIVPAVMITF